MSLTVLDGMGIYERTRLEEEGITGVQALAARTSSTSSSAPGSRCRG
jgi:hypothetical protein